MFNRKMQTAQGVIVSCTGVPGKGVTTTAKGKKSAHEFVVDVRPPGEPPFRAVIIKRVWHDALPHPGDIVKVSYREKDHEAELDIDDDPRYQPMDHREVQQLVQQAKC